MILCFKMTKGKRKTGDGMNREEREAQAVRDMAKEVAEFAGHLCTLRKRSLHLGSTQGQQFWALAVGIEQSASEPCLQPTVLRAAAQVEAAMGAALPVPLTLQNLQNATGLLRDAALANTSLRRDKVVRFLDACWDAGCGPWRLSALGDAALREQGGVMVTADAIAAAVVARGAAHMRPVMEHAFHSPEHLLLAAAVYRAASETDAPDCRTVLVQQLLRYADECANADAQVIALAPLLDAAEDCPQLCAALATALATVCCMYGAAHPLVRDCTAHAGPSLSSRLTAFDDAVSPAP